MKTNHTAEELFDLACTVYGLENQHTTAIGKLVEVKQAGYLDAENADYMAHIIYIHADEELYFVGDPDDPWDEDEEIIEGDNEMGFNPYIGSYDFDC